ncbi:DUF1906 domain-containing protein [Streptomyces varsoviensis]|uniref:DUF1906 domain-containing protein n=1 Tax=Streptomyces varsoviensis TaxID=67373 RepID=UPI0033D18288
MPLTRRKHFLGCAAALTATAVSLTGAMDAQSASAAGTAGVAGHAAGAAPRPRPADDPDPVADAIADATDAANAAGAGDFDGPGPGDIGDDIGRALEDERAEAADTREKPGAGEERTGAGQLSAARATTGDPRAAGATVYKGRAFDTCHAPSLTTLRAWRSSPYRAVGVYYGGRGRACPNQPYLGPRWMRGARAMGWRVLPVYVGSQSRCVGSAHKKHVPIGARPWTQGKAEGRDAVRRAKAMAMAPRSALYLDMEAYNFRKKGCARTTLAFIRGWSRTVRAHGYLPGFYSSADSGVRHMETARRAGVKDLPAVMWFARWHMGPSVNKERSLAGGAWKPHRRIHQYAGDVTETHGGRRMRIDRNAVDAPVAVIK